MTSLRTLHWTDPHEDWQKFAAVEALLLTYQTAGTPIDLQFITGDFIESHLARGQRGRPADDHRKVIDYLVADAQEQQENNELLQNMAATFQEAGITDLDQLDTTQRSSFEDLLRVQTEFPQRSLDTIVNTYKKFNDMLAPLAAHAPIYGVLGNHDLTLGREILDNMAFVDHVAPVNYQKDGIDWKIGGDTNTYEVPNLVQLVPQLQEFFIPYDLGYNVEMYDVGLAREKDADKKQDISSRKMNLLLKQQEERERLGTDPIDIYLTHKLPFYNTFGSSDISQEYGAQAKSIHAGHSHGAQVGRHTDPRNQGFEELFAQATETTIVDGQEVPLVRIGDAPWQINPGVNYVIVTEYDANKEIERMLVYEMVNE